MVANCQIRLSRHVLGHQGLPKYVFHPDLEEIGITRTYTKGLAEYLAETEPPPPDVERQLFQAMHYFAHKARLAQGADSSPTAASRRWIRRRLEIVDHLVRVNVGLVYRIIRSNRFANLDEDELFSEGLQDLFHAVEAFDPWRGYRFSTYACNCIFRGFARLAKQECRRSSLFVQGFDRFASIGADEVSAMYLDDRRYARRLDRILEGNEAGLNDVERLIIHRRFLSPEASYNRDTLEQLGHRICVSKERVRQIQMAAIRKLHDAVMAGSCFS